MNKNSIYTEGYARKLQYSRVLVLCSGSTEIVFGTEGYDTVLRYFMLIQDQSSYDERYYRVHTIIDTESIFYESSEAESDIIEIIKLK